MHLLSFAIILSLLPLGWCFSAAPGQVVSSPRAIYFSHAHSVSSKTTRTRLHSTDDKQAEIAALEVRLKQLKEDETSSERNAVNKPESIALELDEPDEMEGETEDSVMFSEKWKEAKDGYVTKQEEKNMGGLAKVGAALGVVIFLGLFSQVPVGEESLQKYQDVKGNPSRIDLGDMND